MKLSHGCLGSWHAAPPPLWTSCKLLSLLTRRYYSLRSSLLKPEWLTLTRKDITHVSRFRLRTNKAQWLSFLLFQALRASIGITSLLLRPSRKYSGIKWIFLAPSGVKWCSFSNWFLSLWLFLTYWNNPPVNRFLRTCLLLGLWPNLTHHATCIYRCQAWTTVESSQGEFTFIILEVNFHCEGCIYTMEC